MAADEGEESESKVIILMWQCMQDALVGPIIIWRGCLALALCIGPALQSVDRFLKSGCATTANRCQPPFQA